MVFGVRNKYHPDLIIVDILPMFEVCDEFKRCSVV